MRDVYAYEYDESEDLGSDTGDCSAGKERLIRSGRFAERGLQLYCGVDLRDLETADGVPLATEPSGMFDCLVCRGDEVILAVDIAGLDDWLSPSPCLDEFPFACVDASVLAYGSIDHILREIDGRLSQPSLWRCRLKEMSAEQGEPFQHAPGPYLAPAGYSAYLGIARRFERDGSGTPVCSERTEQFLKKPPEASGRADGGRIPLAERSAAARENVYSNPAISARLVREFMSAPLDTYMDGCPEALEQLRQSLAAEDCMEAADEIRQMLIAPKEADALTDGIALMRLFAAPVLEYFKYDTGDESAIARDAPPAAPSGDPPRRRSLAQRASRLRAESPAAQRLSRMSAAVFFQGLSALTGSGYPVWLCGKLQQALGLWPGCSYGRLIHQIHTVIAYEDSGYAYPITGLNALYHAVIEPFVFLRRLRRRQDAIEKGVNSHGQGYAHDRP